MNSYTILRKLDAVGRLVLPLDMRRDLCLEPGGCVRVTLDKQGAGLLLEKASCAGSEKFLMELDGLGRIVIPQALRAALAEKPKLVLVESPSNPLLRVVDIAKICGLAREAGAISVVDNTFLSPALQNPLALGADLVLHSCTKYLNGHSDVVAGVVIAKDPATVTELAWWANNIGVTGSAFDSYLLLRGLRTLSPRMEVAQRNALAIVEYLKTQPLVKKLYHPSLPENQGHEIAARQQKGFGAMLSFELDGDEQTLRRFLSGLSLFTLAESLGGVESLISHAATMTHAGMAPEARAAAGISETLLRISTGIEDGEDLIADLENGFRAANEE